MHAGYLFGYRRKRDIDAIFVPKAAVNNVDCVSDAIPLPDKPSAGSKARSDLGRIGASCLVQLAFVRWQ